MIEKILEACENFTGEPFVNKAGKLVIESTTNEGLTINIFMRQNAKILTAYPSRKIFE